MVKIMIYLLAPKTSVSARQLASACGFTHIWNCAAANRVRNNDLVINYGYSGAKFDRVLRDRPALREARIVNSVSGIRKDSAINRVADAGVSCPDIRTERPLETGWIFKPYRSGGGRGIVRCTANHHYQNGYYQREITNRTYEIRVSAFKWMPRESWGVWKRVCDDRSQLCWNYHQGGRFVTVNNPTNWRVFRDALDAAETVLNTLGMDFGAVDFILDADRQVQFIEINSRPGFNEYGREFYVNTFNELGQIEAHGEYTSADVNEPRNMAAAHNQERLVDERPVDDAPRNNTLTEIHDMLQEGLRIISAAQARLTALGG